MKKQLLIMAILSMTLCACNKETECRTCKEGRPVEVTVQINGTTMTKSTGNTYANESKVNNLQIMAFNAAGDLESYIAKDKEELTNELSVKLVASSGEKTVWALVNAPSLGEVQTLEALESTVSALSDNDLDNFVMTGFTEEVFSDGAVVGITVKRLVARVSIAKISTEFPDTPAYQGKTLSIKGIYMLNVPSGVNYALNEAPAQWYNKLSHADEEADKYLYDGLDMNLDNNSSYDVEHAYYPYPNSVDNSVKNIDEVDRETWSPRRSILCIEVEYDGKTGYYPLEMPVIERNKTYSIEEVVLRRSPADVPYDPIETGEATLSITVSDWEVGLNLGTIEI